MKIFLKMLGSRFWNESKAGKGFKWPGAKEAVCLYAHMQALPRKDTPKKRLHQPADCLLAFSNPKAELHFVVWGGASFVRSMHLDKLRRRHEGLV